MFGRTLRVNMAGGLADEVDTKVLNAAFIPFAFIEFELPEDAQAAIDNMNDGEMFGRTLRVNMAKPMKMKEGSSRPVWASDEWLQKYAGASLAEGGVGADRPKQGLEPQEEGGRKRAG